MNLKKTCAMTFGSKYTVHRVGEINLEVNGTNIELVDEFKYLGIMLDRTLSFSSHVTYLKNKLIGRLKMLGKLRPRVGEEVSLQLYKTLILLVLDYGDVVYDCLSAKDCRRLQTIQNCALRIVKRADKRTPSNVLHTNSSMMYLADCRHMHCCNQVYKIVNGSAPDKLVEKFQHYEGTHNTRARSRHDLVVPPVRLDMSRKNFMYRGPIHWNFLDLDMRLRPSIDSFKYNLKKSDYFAPVTLT